MRPKYTLWWALWILMFGVIEYSALKNKKSGDTLTEHIRELIGTRGKKTVLNWVFRVGLAGLFVWLIPHFFTGAW